MGKKPKPIRDSEWYDALLPDGLRVITQGWQLKTMEGVTDVTTFPRLVTRPLPFGLKCHSCGSEALVRYGVDRKGQQRYRCLICGKTCIESDAPVGMRFPATAIASAINQFYEAASLHKIQRQLQIDYGVNPDPSNIYRWIVRYSLIATKVFSRVRVRVGNIWVADETVLQLKSKGGQNVWFFDIIDDKTRFLLASQLAESRTTRDAQILMERAVRRAGGYPKIIITDKLRSYLDAIERTFGSDVWHVQSTPFSIGTSSRSIERFHNTLKDRTKVLRALANRETAKIVLDGWLVHYNFFRPHGGLGGKTPAEVAGARPLLRNWLDIVRAREA